MKKTLTKTKGSAEVWGAMRRVHGDKKRLRSTGPDNVTSVWRRGQLNFYHHHRYVSEIRVSKGRWTLFQKIFATTAMYRFNENL